MEFLMKASVPVELFSFIVAGLPHSGKTALVNSLFNLPVKERTFPVELHEAIIYRQKMFVDSIWFESDQMQAQVSSILVAFAHVFAKEGKLPHGDQKQLKLEGLFDKEVQGYFHTIFNRLHEPVLGINDESKIERMLYSSLSLVNVFNVGTNRAAYEFLKAIGGRNKRLILVNVLNLVHSDEETLKKPLNPANPTFHDKRIQQNQISLFKERSALHHFVSIMECASISQPQATGNTLIVGTHVDKFPSQSELDKRKREVMQLLKQYGTDMGYKSDSYFPNMVTVNATDKVDCKKVQEALIKLIDNDTNLSINLPVRFIFLRYVLYCTKKTYMSRGEVIEYAEKCGLRDESEVNSFLDIYKSCASIFNYSGKEGFLHSYVILLPIKFMRGLDKLYSVQDNQSIPVELKEPAKCGILSKPVLEALFEGSDEKSMPLWDFYVNVLTQVSLLIEIENGRFFCPSLRLEHSDSDLNPRSLIISSSVALASFSAMQCAFVKYLTRDHEDVTLTLCQNCSYYNSIEFLSTCESDETKGKVTVRFFHDYIEIFVDCCNISRGHATTLYSVLKTDCVVVMNMTNESSYKFAVTCPNSSLKPHALPHNHHFASFDILEYSGENLRCNMCGVAVNEVKGIHWVKAAYQGSHIAAVQAGGKCIHAVYRTRACFTIAEHPSKLSVNWLAMQPSRCL